MRILENHDDIQTMEGMCTDISSAYARQDWTPSLVHRAFSQVWPESIRQTILPDTAVP